MSENKNLGKVKNVKNSTERRLRGLIIEFETPETITGQTVVYLTYEKKLYPFNVYEVEIVGKNLLGRALECGYYAHKLGKDSELDLRTLIDCKVELVEDKQQLEDIREQSCWC
jgi:hypothetical protein